MKKVVFVFVVMFSSLSHSQEGVENILFAGRSDAKLFAQNYFKPGFESFLYSVNNGWFTTAKVFRKLGFEFAINTTTSLVPYDDRSFDFNPNAYNFLTTTNNERFLPTVMSHEISGAKLNVTIPYKDGKKLVSNFSMPEGVTENLPLKALPVPMIQLGFGLPFKTDLRFRFVPTLNYAKNDFDVGLVGLSMQHDLTHYFGVDYDDARFGLSIMGGFTNIDAKYNFYNDKIKNKNITVSKDAAFAYELSAWTVQLLGSMDFENVSFYAAYGYQEAYSKMEIEGTYNLKYDVVNDRDEVEGVFDKTVVNPFRLDFDETGTNKVTAGVSFIVLDFMKIYGEYVFQKPYNSLATGLCFFFK